MRYKHISELNKEEESNIFRKYDDLLDDTIIRVAQNYEEHQINGSLIKEEFHKLLKEADEVIDTRTFKRYQPGKQGGN